MTLHTYLGWLATVFFARQRFADAHGYCSVCDVHRFAYAGQRIRVLDFTRPPPYLPGSSCSSYPPRRLTAACYILHDSSGPTVYAAPVPTRAGLPAFTAVYARRLDTPRLRTVLPHSTTWDVVNTTPAMPTTYAPDRFLQRPSTCSSGSALLDNEWIRHLLVLTGSEPRYL